MKHKKGEKVISAILLQVSLVHTQVIILKDETYFLLLVQSNYSYAASRCYFINKIIEDRVHTFLSMFSLVISVSSLGFSAICVKLLFLYACKSCNEDT